MAFSLYRFPPLCISIFSCLMLTGIARVVLDRETDRNTASHTATPPTYPYPHHPLNRVPPCSPSFAPPLFLCLTLALAGTAVFLEW